ncbi:MAG: sugar phosphate isomerase/epimerase family protein [Acidobacteriaceae bacterium]
MKLSRRHFLYGTGSIAVSATMPLSLDALAGRERLVTPTEQAIFKESRSVATNCPFRLSVINDEISQDFEHSCQVASQEFRLNWIELRGMWNKNLIDLNAQEIAESRRILEKYNLRVTDIASPLFKVDWPGAPLSKAAEHRDQFHADTEFKQQDEVLERCIKLAKAYGTDRIRCFDFWRLEDPKPYRAAMDQKLREAAMTCRKHGLILLLENEMSCNTATGPEAARALSAITNSNFMLNWDPGNAGAAGETKPYPNGYDLLPKKRIGHCHAKNVERKPDGKFTWEPVGIGLVDWPGQLHALAADGYTKAVSLETHWRGAGSPEASTRISMQQLKAALQKAGLSC